MSENYIKPEDVSSREAYRVVDFLNSAQSAEEIDHIVKIPSEMNV